MKKQYEKPIVRNLGDMLPNAQGACQSGAAAYATSGESNCPSGAAASGGACNDGYTASDTCTGGQTAGGNCNAGVDALK